MQRKSEQGFTLVEVMVSIVLTAIAVIGMIALFRVETRASGLSRRETEAAVLAQDKVEQLRTLGTPGTGTDTGIDSNGNTGGMFTRVWSLSVNGDIYNIDVTVSWTDDGQSRTMVIHSHRGSGS